MFRPYCKVLNFFIATLSQLNKHSCRLVLIHRRRNFVTGSDAMLRRYHVVLLAGGVISAQPVHRILGVPLHHLPALRTRIPAQVKGQHEPHPQRRPTL